MFRQIFTVRSYELDSLGHMNNAVYFSWLEEATFAALAERGLPFCDLRDHGWLPILVHAAIDFRREAKACDRIAVVGWPAAYGITSLTVGYRLERIRDGARIAEGQRVWVVVDTQGKKIPVPQELRDAFGEPISEPRSESRR